VKFGESEFVMFIVSVNKAVQKEEALELDPLLESECNAQFLYPQLLAMIESTAAIVGREAVLQAKAA